MNTLLWLWDVLVVERRLTHFTSALNDAYDRGCKDAAITDATDKTIPPRQTVDKATILRLQKAREI